MAKDTNIIIELDNTAFPPSAGIFRGGTVSFIPSDDQVLTIKFVNGNPFGWKDDEEIGSAGNAIEDVVVRGATGEYEYMPSSGGQGGNNYKLIVQG